MRKEHFIYAKIFTQIFDSSIAENYEVRHVFEDMLKLADIDGVVDMTLEAIQRRTNAPMEMVKAGIEALSRPDPKSRSKEYEGRRIIPLDSGRDWGWIIVNYGHYRRIQDEFARRAYFRDAKRLERAKKKGKKAKPSTITGRGPMTGETLSIRMQEHGFSEEAAEKSIAVSRDESDNGVI